MSKFYKVSLLAFCIIISVNFSLAQKTKSKTKAVKVSQPKVDVGVLRQNTYTNTFFALKLEFPTGWLVGDNTLEAQLVAIQKATVKTKNAKNQKSIDAAMEKVTPLLGGYRAMPGSKAENSNLRIVVENLAANPTIKTGQDYLRAMIYSLKLIKLPADYVFSDIKSEMLGGKSVEYIESKYLNNQKRSYAIVKKGFAVLITIDAFDQEDFDELHQVLENADLDYQK